MTAIMATQGATGVDVKSPYDSSSRESTRNPEAGLMADAYLISHEDKSDYADMQRLGKKQEFKAGIPLPNPR